MGEEKSKDYDDEDDWMKAFSLSLSEPENIDDLSSLDEQNVLAENKKESEQQQADPSADQDMPDSEALCDDVSEQRAFAKNTRNEKSVPRDGKGPEEESLSVEAVRLEQADLGEDVRDEQIMKIGWLLFRGERIPHVHLETNDKRNAGRFLFTAYESFIEDKTNKFFALNFKVPGDGNVNLSPCEWHKGQPCILTRIVSSSSLTKSSLFHICGCFYNGQDACANNESRRGNTKNLSDLKFHFNNSAQKGAAQCEYFEQTSFSKWNTIMSPSVKFYCGTKVNPVALPVMNGRVPCEGVDAVVSHDTRIQPLPKTPSMQNDGYTDATDIEKVDKCLNWLTTIVPASEETSLLVSEGESPQAKIIEYLSQVQNCKWAKSYGVLEGKSLEALDRGSFIVLEEAEPGCLEYFLTTLIFAEIKPGILNNCREWINDWNSCSSYADRCGFFLSKIRSF